MSVKRKNICSTEGIEVMAFPRFSEEYSNAALNKYIYEYDIVIKNNSPNTMKLIFRKWEIIDGFGIKRLVSGEGVIGLQPELAHGESFTYSSWCPLSTPIGIMRGIYTMKREMDDALFEIVVPELLLSATQINN